MKDKKEKKCEQCEEHLAGWKRALADYDNLQKDLAREKTEMRNYAIESILNKLIPVIDHFDQGLRNRPDEIDGIATWLEGMEIVQKEMIQLMEEMGCEEIDGMGILFDPNKHEAVGTVSDESQTDDIIIEVIESGWSLGNKIVRPAKVIVNKIS